MDYGPTFHYIWSQAPDRNLVLEALGSQKVALVPNCNLQNAIEAKPVFLVCKKQV